MCYTLYLYGIAPTLKIKNICNCNKSDNDEKNEKDGQDNNVTNDNDTNNNKLNEYSLSSSKSLHVLNQNCSSKSNKTNNNDYSFAIRECKLVSDHTNVPFHVAKKYYDLHNKEKKMRKDSHENDEDEESSYSSSSSNQSLNSNDKQTNFNFVRQYLCDIGRDEVAEGRSWDTIRDLTSDLNLMLFIDTNVVNKHMKKSNRAIISLQRQIYEICGKYLMDCQMDFIHYNIYHVDRFLKNLLNNKIWDLGLKAECLWSKETTQQCGHDPPRKCLCPCSYLMIKWHKKYISRKGIWKEHIKTVPCQTSLMEVSKFKTHIQNFKNKDMYHHMIYMFMKEIYSIN